jgi:hypothetical protein
MSGGEPIVRFVPEVTLLGRVSPLVGAKLKPASRYTAIVLNERLRCPAEREPWHRKNSGRGPRVLEGHHGLPGSALTTAILIFLCSPSPAL